MAPEPRSRLGSNVFILGAGASFHAGIPLLRDFIARSQSLFMDARRDLLYRDSFRTALEWIDGLRTAAYYVDVDLGNLEHVFSLAQLARECGQKEGLEVYRALTHLILETIDQSCALTWASDPEKPQPTPTYQMFFRRLLERNLGEPDLQPDPIITLNYDVLLDYAMFEEGTQPGYGVGEWSDDSRFVWPLHKLHGSLNWATHEECSADSGKSLSLLKLAPEPENIREMPRGGAERVPFRMVTRNMQSTECPACKTVGALTPVVIPPTWSKSPLDKGIGKVWQRAAEAISKATQIIIIGYSLPETDTFFPYLLALGLQRNSSLRRVLVLNPDDSGRTKERYERAFARSLKERGALVYKDQTFEDLVDPNIRRFDQFSLENVLQLADVPGKA